MPLNEEMLALGKKIGDPWLFKLSRTLRLVGGKSNIFVRVCHVTDSLSRASDVLSHLIFA